MTMRRRSGLARFAGLIILTATQLQAQRISDDRDLIAMDLAGWDCLNQPGGSAKTDDGVERNRQKNRAAISLAGLSIPNLETASFLQQLSAFEAQTQFGRRKNLSPAQKLQLAALEKQLVSFTGYLVLAYAGPPETTNCASIDMHDWHLEVFEKASDHPPRVGDPTPIVCEITPRTQGALYAAGIRVQDLAAFMRRPDLSYEGTGHPARRIRLTGYLLWDDDHNGRADIGSTITSLGKEGYHHPWRATAWEIHPVLKIEALDRPAVTTAPASSRVFPPAIPAPTPPVVTILEPVTVKIPYGETVLPRGMKLEVVSRSAQTVNVRYLNQTVTVPRQSTDLR